MASLRIKAPVSLCLLLVFLVYCLSAEPLRAATAGVVLVAAIVEGRAGMFLLDTGANRSCLDTAFAARLGLVVESPASLTRNYGEDAAGKIRVHEFGIGQLHLHDLSMLSTDLSASFGRAGVAVDGIIGTDVLRLAVVKIDFSSGTARFALGGQTPPGEQMVELQPVGSLYFISLIVQGTPTRMLLDTGTNFTSVSSAAWSRVTAHWQPLSMIDGIRSTGGSNNAQFVLIPQVSIGGSPSRDVPLRIQPQTESGLFSDMAFDGLLGSDVLRPFFVTLDLANNKMYLARNRNSHVDRYLFSTIGIQFAKNDDGRFTIVAVWTPSPAAAAGLQIGDLIVSVNDLDVRRMSLDELSREFHGEPGTALHLVIDSAGREHVVPVAINCLLCPVKNASLRPR